MRPSDALKPCSFCGALLLLFAAGFGGCAGQGEGDLCNRQAGNNGNDDCQNGLECDTSVTSTPGFGRCCPGNRALATTTTCKGGTGPIDASPVPPDSSTTQTMQSPPEASAPQPTESGSDEEAAPDAEAGATE